MNTVQRAVFPGILLGSLFIVFLANIISNPTIVLASTSGESAQSNSVVAPVLEVFNQEILSQDTAPAQPVSSESQANNADTSLSVTDQTRCAHYPLSVSQWCDQILNSAYENGVDHNLVAAVITQESGGDPQAYSKSGAVGLMQVMPRDGLAAGFMCVNGPCFSSRPATDELYNPTFNISYGSNMLAGLIRKYGSEREALRAYGPMNVGYYYADIVLSIYNQYLQSSS